MKMYKVIGLMSGTSLDGLDMAHCTFWQEDGTWQFRIDCAESIAYDAALQKRLQEAVHFSAESLLLFHNEFGRYMGKHAQNFITKYNLDPDFVASHGHTIFHQPEKSFTYQMGSGHELARVLNLPVVCDFRSYDVALGGQGAPLVPIGDALLFPHFDFCLNLGGIANVSFNLEGQRIAFDIAPMNMLLNPLAAQLGVPYDEGGALARQGTLNSALFEALNALSFYQAPFPKSLGYEWFQQSVLPLVEASEVTVHDKLCTAVHHVAHQIAKSVSAARLSAGRLMATGGGAKNQFFIETLQEYVGVNMEVVVPEATIVDFKEAMVFALMGVLRWRNEVNILHTVTGARCSTSAGILYYP